MLRFQKWILVVFLGLTVQGCLSSKDGEVTAVATNPEQGPLSVFDVNLYSLNKVVCDPFDPGAPGPNDGLIATLYYRGQHQERWYSVWDYIEQGQKSAKHLFFSTINVPTRAFSAGFPTETGGVVQNDAGQNLDEYFALSFSSVLKLSPSDEAGEYELALLSDDGAFFSVRQSDGSYRTVVSNDGDHPTRLGCGERIHMDHESELVVKLDYYQGPRYHISLIPMWRKVTAQTTPEPRCGDTGNELFFDSNNNSYPQPAYTQLLNRGWKPIDAANWHLPAFAIFNPCTTGKVPVISDFKIDGSVEGIVSFSWQTDIPASSQISYRHVASGAENITVGDNRLRLQHQVVIAIGLEIGQTYDFQAVSISADYGKAISQALRLKVQ